MDSLSVDKHCEILTSHMRDRISSMRGGFKNFIQMYSAIVGGVVVLSLQYRDKIPPSFETLSNILISLVYFMATIHIVEELCSWYRLRKKLSAIAGMDQFHKPLIPFPKIWPSMIIELAMLAVMLIAFVVFYMFNPL